MSKAKFMVMGFLHCKPPPEKFDKCKAYLEEMYQYLTDEGIIPKSDEPKPREGVDWHARLDEQKRAWFDRFWKAYNAVPTHRKSGGKQQAAMRWGQIPEMGAALAERIIKSAAADARVWSEAPREGQTRIYAQGWLTERRWEDHAVQAESITAPSKGPSNDKAAALRDARGDVAYWERMQKDRPDDLSIAMTLDKARAKLAELEAAV